VTVRSGAPRNSVLAYGCQTGNSGPTVDVVFAPDGPPLLHLPVVYAVALALRDAGLDADDIAHRLDLSIESMPALFEIAEAKLSAIRFAVGDEAAQRKG
jgi:hypothetical protein